MAWLTARCPVSQKAEAWIEDSLQWLLQEFGAAELNGEVLLPESIFGPGPVSGTEADLHVALRRLCARMSVPVERVKVEVIDDGAAELDGRLPVVSQYDGIAGHYQRSGDKFIVAIGQRQLSRPVTLAATLAHELGHVRLLGEQRVEASRKDQEQLTDLATVFFGVGVCNANAAFDFAQGQFGGWRTSQLGYLGEALFGYALAYYCHLRGELDPPWARALDTNPRVYMRKGLRYLRTKPQRVPD